MLTAKDDAVAFTALSGYKDEAAAIEKYQRNIIKADNRNSLQETSFANAEGVMLELKQLFIQAHNGALSAQDLDALMGLAKNSQAQLLGIANTQDETGGYIFSGYQIEQKPFNLQPDNSVIYQGDSGERELQIAKNVLVATNQPGDQAFENVANPIGDFSATYPTNSSGIAVNRAVVVDRSAYNAAPAANPAVADYRFSFTSPTDLTIVDETNAVVFSTASYTSGQVIAFNGMEVTLSGNPLPGDSIELDPQENISIFDTIKSAIGWLAAGPTPANPVQHSVDYSDILGQLDNALNHMTSRRTDAGARLQLIESQENHHLDAQLYLSAGQSRIEDLDFAKAISAFEQSKVALQAAQQTFIQVKNLSLFNYM